MPEPSKSHRVWNDTPHASLCLLGTSVQQHGILTTLEQGVTIKQKTLRYTPAQKVTMVLIGLLSGMRSVSNLDTTLRVDPAVQRAFGLPGCAEQSVIADTVNAATAADVAALRTAIEGIMAREGTALHHDFAAHLLVLDVDLSPAPCGRTAEGARRGYMGRHRGRQGRKLLRVRAAASQETLYETVIPGNAVESLPLVEEVVARIETLYAMDGADQAAAAKRAQTEWRMDSGWGSDSILTFLIGRGYQVIGKFRSHSRIRRLARSVEQWEPAHYAETEWGYPQAPAVFARPLQQVVVRHRSTAPEGGDRYTVFFSTRSTLAAEALLTHYDDRAGTEADIKSDKRGLGLAAIRKRSMAAQQIVVLLTQLAHNLLLWSRSWLAALEPALARLGLVRLIGEVWAIPGRVKIQEGAIVRVLLRPEHRRARQVSRGLKAFLLPGQTLAFLGQT
jgi:hypothetical protein